MPIYKAEYSYPLIVLKRLMSDKHTPHNVQRVLVLDSDGDLAIVNIPLMYELEKEPKEYKVQNSSSICAIVSQNPEGLAANYMKISQPQRKALNTITRYFEETGVGKQPISATVKTVLAKAKDRVSSPAK